MSTYRLILDLAMLPLLSFSVSKALACGEFFRDSYVYRCPGRNLGLCSFPLYDVAFIFWISAPTGREGFVECRTGWERKRGRVRVNVELGEISRS